MNVIAKVNCIKNSKVNDKLLAKNGEICKVCYKGIDAYSKVRWLGCCGERCYRKDNGGNNGR